MPETPRFLVKRGRKAKAKEVLKRVYGDAAGMDNLASAILRSVEREILEEEQVAPSSAKPTALTRLTSTFNLLTTGANARALTLTCLLQAGQQLCGFNTLMYFSATIFSLVGFSAPTLTALSIALTNFAFTLVAFHFIDRLGRRRILLLSIPVMVTGLTLCAVAFSFIDLGTGAADAPAATANGIWPPTLVLSLLLYVAAYALGLGCVPWQQSELFPLRVRALGSGLATSTNWLCNTLIG
ncbi:hypothetical protein N0V95_010000, partial [Ascochyta clinopodiicola]